MKVFFQRFGLIVCLLIGSVSFLFAQNRAVTGTVTDEKGEGLPGATVLVKGTTVGTSTGVDGSFSLNLPANAKVLVISSVGAQSTEVQIGAQTTFNVSLKNDVKALDEVVVVGYGTVRKSDVTGSVATIKSEQLTQIATPNVTQAIQGRVAGVDVSSNGGDPGGATRIRIRGVGTINNSDPLYVVDGFQTNDISFLAPGDVASMEILKDASATAIYGSRGANGVVLITTKRGKSGKAKFLFDSYMGVQQAWKHEDLLNAGQYAALRLEAFANDGVAIDPTNSQMQRLLDAKNNNLKGTDWQNEVLRTGAIRNYSLNVLGGTDAARYSITGTYFDQEGILKNTGLKKYFVRFNNDYTLAPWLTAGLSAAFSHSDRTATTNDLYSGVLTTALRVDPLTPAWNSATNNWGRADISYENNPARAVSEQAGNKGYYDVLNTNAYAEATFLKHFKFRSQFGVNYSNTHNKNYLPQFYIDNVEQRANSSLTELRAQQTQWVASNYLTYTNDFGKDHHLTVLAGTEAQRNQYDGLQITAYNVPADTDLRYLSSSRNATTYNLGQVLPSDESLLSFFGRANYNFKDRYLLTATLRYDGSSRFLASNRWGTFPSFAFGWNVMDEPFMQGIRGISNLKLRAGWGQVGNQNSAANYGYVTTLTGGNRYIIGGQTVEGFAATTASNPQLKWETATSTNVGIDAGFFNNALSLTADYFVKNTNDMIVRVPIPVFAGVGPPYVNAGSMQNNGIELALNYRNQTESGFQYDFGVNFTHIKNRVTSLGGGSPIETADVSRVGNITRTEVGREIAYFYGLKTDGVFHNQAELEAYKKDGVAIQPNAQLGDVKFVDLNGDGVIDDKDRTYLGSATPSFTYGFNANFAYKGFDLKLFFQGVQGAEIVNALGYFTHNSNGQWNSMASRLDRWTPENPNSNEPRMTVADANQNYRFSDRYVENGSYLRLKNVTLGYTLPNKLVSKWRINNVRAYVSADNLLTFTKYTGLDPEVGDYGYNGSSNPLAYGVDVGTYPQPRTARVGLTVNF